MTLRPRVVNHVLGPVGIRTLLHPEDSVIVRGGGHQVLATVAINIHGVNKSGLAEIEVRMPDPLARSRIRRGFKPALRRNDIRPPGAVDIARADCVSIRLRALLVLACSTL